MNTALVIFDLFVGVFPIWGRRIEFLFSTFQHFPHRMTTDAKQMIEFSKGMEVFVDNRSNFITAFMTISLFCICVFCHCCS